MPHRALMKLIVFPLPSYDVGETSIKFFRRFATSWQLTAVAVYILRVSPCLTTAAQLKSSLFSNPKSLLN